MLGKFFGRKSKVGDQIRNDSERLSQRCGSISGPISNDLRPETRELFENITKFFEHREGMDAIWKRKTGEAMRTDGEDDGEEVSLEDQTLEIFGNITWEANRLLKDGSSDQYRPDMRQQRCSDPIGAPVRHLEDVYEAAGLALPLYMEVMKRVVNAVRGLNLNGGQQNVAVETRGPPVIFPFKSNCLEVAPLKSRSRSAEKAGDDYVDRFPGPGCSWVMDLIRGSIICDSVPQMKDTMVALNEVVEEVGGEVVKCKNRCLTPTASGFRDIICKVRLPISVPGTNVTFHHVCEVQVHIRAMIEYDQKENSHKSYEYFRSYFGGNMATVQMQMASLKMLYEKRSESLSVTLQTICQTGTREELEGIYELLSAKVAEFKMALNVAERILELLINESDGSNDAQLKILDAKTNVADMVYKIGDYRKCLPMYQEVADGKEKICGGDSLSIVRPLANLGNCFRVTGQYDPARVELRRAQKIFEKYCARVEEEGMEGEENGVFSVDAAIMYTNLGTLYRRDKRHRETMQVLEKALVHYEATLGPEHEETAIVLGSMGLTQQAMGLLPEAEAKFKKALKIKIKTVGPNNYTVASTLFSMGVLYGSALNDLPKALEYLSRARDIYVRTVGETHRSTSNLDAWLRQFEVNDPSTWHKSNSSRYNKTPLSSIYGAGEGGI